MVDINFRELYKVEKVEPGDKLYLSNYNATGTYIGSFDRSHIFVFEDMRPEDSKHYIPYDKSYLVRTIKDNDVAKLIPNILKCAVITNYGRSIRVGGIKLLQGTNPLSSSDFRYLPMSRGLKSIIKVIKNRSERRSSNKKIATMLLGTLPVELSNLNEIGTLTVYSETSTDGIITGLASFNNLKMSKNVLQKNPKAPVDCFDRVKIGRIVKKVTGEMFTNVEIETFSNTFNSYLQDSSKYTLEVVKGDDIMKWYNVRTYTHECRGTLHNSCMRHGDHINKIRFYALHPKCSMVIVRKGESLHARALLWELNNGERYLDRIYYSKSIESAQILKWADEQGIKITHSSRGSEGKGDALFVETNLDDPCYKGVDFPWIDSFRYVSYDFGYLISMGDANLIRKSTKELYGRGFIGCTNAGSIQIFLANKKSYRIPKDMYHIINLYDSNVRFAKPEDCVLYNIQHYHKDHVDNDGVPLTRDQLLKKFGPLQNKKSAKEEPQLT